MIPFIEYPTEENQKIGILKCHFLITVAKEKISPICLAHYTAIGIQIERVTPTPNMDLQWFYYVNEMWMKTNYFCQFLLNQIEKKCCKTTIKSNYIPLLKQKKLYLLNKQACKENGIGPLDRQHPYAFGDEELHLTCNLCSINLEMYKLLNQL